MAITLHKTAGASWLPTRAEVERAKWQAHQERLEHFFATGDWVGDDGRIVHPKRTTGRAE